MIAVFLRKPHGAKSFWVTNSRRAIEDTSSFVYHKTHYFVHKWPPLYHVLGHLTPVHTAHMLTSHVFWTHFNMLPTMSKNISESFSLILQGLCSHWNLTPFLKCNNYEHLLCNRSWCSRNEGSSFALYTNEDWIRQHNMQGDQKVSVQLMIIIQKATSNVQSVPHQSSDQGDTRPTLTLSVIPNSNCVIMVSDWNCLKYFCLFLYCNHQVHRDFLITLYIQQEQGYMFLLKILRYCQNSTTRVQ
jgi:hypothetical protein